MEKKVFKLNYFIGEVKDIKDPWYTRDFDTAYKDIYDGVFGLLKYIEKNK